MRDNCLRRIERIILDPAGMKPCSLVDDSRWNGRSISTDGDQYRNVLPVPTALLVLNFLSSRSNHPLGNSYSLLKACLIHSVDTFRREWFFTLTALEHLFEQIEVDFGSRGIDCASTGSIEGACSVWMKAIGVLS